MPRTIKDFMGLASSHARIFTEKGMSPLYEPTGRWLCRRGRHIPVLIEPCGCSNPYKPWHKCLRCGREVEA